MAEVDAPTTVRVRYESDENPEHVATTVGVGVCSRYGVLKLACGCRQETGEQMEITVKKSGGALSPATDETWGPVETKQAGDVGEQLEGLVKSADFFELPSDYPPQGPDRFSYKIAVTDGEKHHAVSYSEGSDGVPPDLKRITELMKQQAGA